ncbi:hypothetical protein [Bradyrhizobium canariense]|nr:hypothetical protein [Bradyrhizobium canariense]
MKTPKPKQWTDREVQQLSKLARTGAGVSKIEPSWAVTQDQ